MKPQLVRALAWLVAALALLLTACGPATPKTFGTGITGYNFTGEGVQRYFVEGQYGSNLPPYGGGGATSCCVVLPAKWTPQLKVRVDWMMGHYTKPWSERQHMTVEQEMACCWTQRTLSRTVPIQPYDKAAGTLQVFFLANDEIKVYVSSMDLGHDKHPSGMAYPRAPTDPKP